MRAPLWQRRLVTGLSWYLAFALLLFAPLKFYPGGLFGYPSYAEKFVAWGYPAWAALVVGGVELFCAALLFLPRRRFLGAAVLVLLLTGAVTTHIVNHDTLADSISAPVHLVLAAIIALAYWPADWRAPLALGGLDGSEPTPARGLGGPPHPVAPAGR
jgi:uncharacterized membrane protein YphA (DoxX/SURF4 family)